METPMDREEEFRDLDLSWKKGCHNNVIIRSCVHNVQVRGQREKIKRKDTMDLLLPYVPSKHLKALKACRRENFLIEADEMQ
jgi:hypothetical protein